MSELVLRNRQRVRALDLRPLRRIARALLEDILGLRSYELGVHCVAAPEMIRLNQAFLEHAGSTDVITFDHADASNGLAPACGGEGWSEKATREAQASGGQESVRSPSPGRREARPALHGEIFICLRAAVDHAPRFRTTWQSELVRYLVHGVLHLRGHDDLDAASRRRMKREEDRLLRELARRFRLSHLARRPRVRA
jgi:rRNA maturation RNase YbeY